MLGPGFRALDQPTAQALSRKILETNMADARFNNSVDFENYKFISLLEYSADNRKISRTKHLLNARQEQLFLPEGHCSCILWERTTKESEEKFVGIAFVGGARYMGVREIFNCNGFCFN